MKKLLLVLAFFLLMPSAALADETINFSASTNSDLWFGRANTQNKLARSFVPAANATAADPTLCPFKVGSPTDNVVFAIYSDSSGSPGSSLASVSTSGSALGTSCSSPASIGAITVSLTAGTTYWVVVERSGALSDSAHYSLNYTSATTVDFVKRNLSGTWTAFNDADFQGSLFLTEPADVFRPFIANLLWFQ